jgi:hypothetical protein
MSATPPIHPEVAHLVFLLGTWRGESRGKWDPSAEVVFSEETLFSHVGKPWLAYRQQTWNPQGVASHGESGYLIARGEEGAVDWMIAQPSGVVEVQVGSVRDGRIVVRSHAIGRAPTARNVTAVSRTMSVEGDTLRYELRISINDEPPALHIEGRLHRAS